MHLKAGQFYGHHSQELAADGFLFVERKYSPNGKIPKHAHERAHLCFVLSGGYLESIGERTYKRSPSALVYYPEDITHGEEHFIDGRHFLVEIDPVVLERMRCYGARLDEPVSIKTASALWLASRMYREFVACDAFASVVLESMANELLVATTRTLSPTADNAPKWLGSFLLSHNGSYKNLGFGMACA